MPTLANENDNAELDRMQTAYQAAVDEWRAAIREEELRNKAKAAKKEYEAALRMKFFQFR
jgi:hypothetical protein